MLAFATPYGRIEFNQCAMGGAWSDCAGVFLFAEPPGRVVFVGAAESFRDELDGHGRWAAARDAGASAVYAVPIADPALRRNVESWLLRALRPPLNGSV